MLRKFVLFEDGVEEIIQMEDVFIIFPVEILPKGWYRQTYQKEGSVIVEVEDKNAYSA